MHKVSAAVAVAVLAVKVCMAHMVVLVPEGSFGTEDQDHFEKGLQGKKIKNRSTYISTATESKQN